MSKLSCLVRRRIDWHFAALLLLTAYLFWPLAYEVRAVREILRLMPFRAVVVEQVWVVPPDRHLYLAGSMVKVRCQINDKHGLTAYVVAATGKSYRSVIRTDLEDAVGGPPGTRAPGPQQWGPWVILPPADVEPVRWGIWAHHYCPETRQEQVNLFASGTWPGRSEP